MPIDGEPPRKHPEHGEKGRDVLSQLPQIGFPKIVIPNANITGGGGGNALAYDGTWITCRGFETTARADERNS